ncbi:hypothetical protein CLF_110701, partial [Clonorchis sinensis]
SFNARLSARINIIIRDSNISADTDASLPCSHKVHLIILKALEQEGEKNTGTSTTGKKCRPQKLNRDWPIFRRSMDSRLFTDSRIDTQDRGFRPSFSGRFCSCRSAAVVNLKGTSERRGISKNLIPSGKEVKHRETRFVVHGFGAGNYFRSSSLDTLNGDYVFRAYRVDNLVGIFKERSDLDPIEYLEAHASSREKVRRLIRRTANAFWADFSRLVFLGQQNGSNAFEKSENVASDLGPSSLAWVKLPVNAGKFTKQERLGRNPCRTGDIKLLEVSGFCSIETHKRKKDVALLFKFSAPGAVLLQRENSHEKASNSALSWIVTDLGLEKSCVIKEDSIFTSEPIRQITSQVKKATLAELQFLPQACAISRLNRYLRNFFREIITVTIKDSNVSIHTDALLPYNHEDDVFQYQSENSRNLSGKLSSACNLCVCGPLRSKVQRFRALVYQEDRDLKRRIRQCVHVSVTPPKRKRQPEPSFRRSPLASSRISPNAARRHFNGSDGALFRWSLRLFESENMLVRLNLDAQFDRASQTSDEYAHLNLMQRPKPSDCHNRNFVCSWNITVSNIQSGCRNSGVVHPNRRLEVVFRKNVATPDVGGPQKRTLDYFWRTMMAKTRSSLSKYLSYVHIVCLGEFSATLLSYSCSLVYAGEHPCYAIDMISMIYTMIQDLQSCLQPYRFILKLSSTHTTGGVLLKEQATIWYRNSPSRLGLGQPGNITALVLPLGGMAARHQKGATAERPTIPLKLSTHYLKKQRCITLPSNASLICVLLRFNESLVARATVKRIHQKTVDMDVNHATNVIEGGITGDGNHPSHGTCMARRLCMYESASN